ncbi:MAG: sensor histidine kinase [Puniceicoccaceae bacterium]
MGKGSITPSKKQERGDADRIDKLSQLLFSIAAFLIIAWIVVSSLFFGEKTPTFIEGAVLAVSGIIFVFLPYFHQLVRQHSTNPPETTYTLERQETTRWDWIFSFLIFLPSALFLYYWNVNSSHVVGLSFGILCMAASYCSIFLPIWGILVFCILVNTVFPFTIYQVYDYRVPAGAIILSMVGTFCICLLITLAGSAQRARKRSEILAGELEESNTKLRNYSLNIEELAINKERNRMAREIHDSLGHYLTVVNVQIEAAKAIFDQKPDLAKEALDKAQSYTKQGLTDLRNSVYTMRESPLKNKDLGEALQEILDEASKSGISTNFDTLGTNRNLSEAVQFTLFRSAQEAVTNAHKHANANSLMLTLDFSKAEQITMTIKDDGVGCEDFSGGFGILGITERVKLLKGDLKINSSINAGFELQIEIPA